MLHCRNYLILLLFSLAGASMRLPAQEGERDIHSFATVDSVSYQYYLDKDWDMLDAFCKTAFDEGFDYYYLRIRAGIASYEMHQYRKAIVHFQRALIFNSGDPLASSYLFGCYLQAEEYEEARWLTKSFDSSFAVEMKTQKLSPIGFVYTEGAYKIPSRPENYMNGLNVQLGLGHYISRRFSIYHAATYYNQNEFRNGITQLQYFIQPSIPLKKNFLLTAGFHLVREKLVRHPPPPPPGGAQPPEGPTDFLFGIVNAVTITRHSTFFDYSLGATASFMDSLSQYQASASLEYYPLANNRILLGAYLYAHTENDFAKMNFAFVPVVRVMLTPRIIIGGNYYTNPEGNISEYTGLLVNNAQDITMSRWSANLSAGITRKIYLTAAFQQEKKFEPERVGRYSYNTFVFGIRVLPGG